MKNTLPSLLQIELQQNGTSKFFLISFAAHILMAVLLATGGGIIAGRQGSQQAQIVKNFNVELIDVTMDKINFDPRLMEDLKVVRQKTKKSKMDSPKTKAESLVAQSSEGSAKSPAIINKEAGSVLGRDSNETSGSGELEGESRRILMSYRDYLINYLNNGKGYPRIAEKLRQEGKVILELEINSKGSIAALKIVSSSNFKLLDTAALNHVKSLSPFKELPSAADKYKVEVPIVYQIN